MKIDKNIIKELSDYLEEFNLTEIEITEKDTKIKVSKNNISISNQPVAASPTVNTQSGDTLSKNNIQTGKKLLHQLLVLHIMHLSLELKNLLRWEKKLKKVIP